MQCPSCGQNNRDDARFCGGCGGALVAEITCNACQRINPVGQKFCDGCGKPLGIGQSDSRSISVARSAEGVVLPESFADGRYRVQRFLGEGAKKRVYLAQDTRLGRDVAIGIIKTDQLDANARERTEREARAMGRLGEHPHVVNVYDVDEDGDALFVVSQYVDGGDLEREIVDAPEHQLPIETVLRVADELLQALEHAHSNGVIHRDVKPANVYLAADGRSKLGDFGLARAAEQARMTTEGSMLGTVAYMPPEQALGSDASPRSDLYSLGCLVYEMVTGRAPFVGNDAVAVISQHLNTAPVALSWHRPECPPDLERVVLQLLAKSATERPESAASVRAELAAIDPAARAGESVRTNPLERLAQGVFVGRETELTALRRAFDNALGGRGELVMLVGEPGIGKTRTTFELETYARMRGAQVLWGRCYEESGVPAYWPWIQIGRAWAMANEIDALEPDPEGNAELIRLFPELRSLSPTLPEPSAVTDPDAAQFRLFSSYTNYLRRAATLGPLILVLDDLHWADKPSLLLLQHFVREIERMPVLVVGTFRDTDLSRGQPLAEALAALNREAGFQRVVLRGLSRDEVTAYIHSVSHVDPALPVLERIFEETEGNPFFLSEVVNLMAQEGTLEATSLSDVAIPDGVREALGRRLDRISEQGNALLATAAVVGREFPYATLALIDEYDETTLLRLIEEALDARVIEEMDAPGRYRFTHALMQETLLAELSTTHRIHQHARIAEAMEKRWGERADERAASLARHFVEAATLTERHTEKAIHYSQLAAVEARSQSAWAEAARRYQDCLMLTGPDTPAGDRAELLTALGSCARSGGDYRTAWRSLLEAADLYGEEHPEGLARATLEIMQFFGDPRRQEALLDRALNAIGEHHPELEARLLLAHGPMSDGEQVGVEIGRARQLINEHGFENLQPALIGAEARLAGAAGQFDEAVAKSREGFHRFETHQDWAGAGRAIAGVGTGDTFARFENVDEAAAEARWALEQSRKYRVEVAEQNILIRLSGLALARCEFDEFRERCDQLVGDNYEVDIQRATYAEWRDDQDRALALMPGIRRGGTFPSFVVQLAACRTRLLFNAGREDEARRELAVVWDTLPDVRSRGMTLYWVAAELDENAGLLLEADQLQMLFDSLGDYPYWDALVFRSCRRLRGTFALALGQIDVAADEFASALEWTTAQRLCVEAGRSHEGLAEVAERRDDTELALRHLEQAIELYRPHGLRRLLDRALSARLRLQNIDPNSMQATIHAVAASVESRQPDLSAGASPDGTVTLMFSDMEDYTGMLERLGDNAAHALVQSHNEIVRHQTREFGGHEVELRGDGFLLAFPSARQAALCAVALQRAFSARGTDDADHPIRIRIGLHTGETIRDADTFFGKSVVQAFRIADLAGGDEILLSAMTHDLVESAGDLQFDEGREVELKGLSGVHRVFALDWA